MTRAHGRRRLVRLLLLPSLVISLVLIGQSPAHAGEWTVSYYGCAFTLKNGIDSYATKWGSTQTGCTRSTSTTTCIYDAFGRNQGCHSGSKWSWVGFMDGLGCGQNKTSHRLGVYYGGAWQYVRYWKLICA
jgi:hypothetical protein